jgi:hypothetical protein
MEGSHFLLLPKKIIRDDDFSSNDLLALILVFRESSAIGRLACAALGKQISELLEQREILASRAGPRQETMSGKTCARASRCSQ